MVDMLKVLRFELMINVVCRDAATSIRKEEAQHETLCRIGWCAVTAREVNME
jgi:hypothetical protein